MSKCPRCGKENADIHTCTPKKYRSECCNARVYACGGRFRVAMELAIKVPAGQTMYSECAKCKKPCNLL